MFLIKRQKHRSRDYLNSHFYKSLSFLQKKKRIPIWFIVILKSLPMISTMNCPVTTRNWFHFLHTLYLSILFSLLLEKSKCQYTDQHGCFRYGLLSLIQTYMSSDKCSSCGSVYSSKAYMSSHPVFYHRKKKTKMLIRFTVLRKRFLFDVSLLHLEQDQWNFLKKKNQYLTHLPV